MENFLVSQLYKHKPRVFKKNLDAKEQDVDNEKLDKNKSIHAKLNPAKLSTCKALINQVCCGKRCCKESKIDRLFRKGRSKVDQDMNIIDIIRNQKVALAAVN